MSVAKNSMTPSKVRKLPTIMAEPDVEHEAEDDERRGNLNTNAKGTGDHSGDERRGVARGRQFARLEHGVAVIERVPLSILIGLLFLFALLGAMMSFFLDYAGGVMHALAPHG